MLDRPLPLQRHGYSPIYHLNEVNRCPGCDRSQWLIGRITAECAFCGTALPLEHSGLEGTSMGDIYWNRDIMRHGWHTGAAWHRRRPAQLAWNVPA